MKQINPTGVARKGRMRNGFTLIELLVVMAVILILAAIFLRGYQYMVTESQVKTCLVRMKLIAAALDEYRRDTGYYIHPAMPIDANTTPKDWLAPKYCAVSDFTDPWGSAFLYDFFVKGKDGRDYGLYMPSSGHKQVPFSIRSLGPNRCQENGDGDDIYWPAR